MQLRSSFFSPVNLQLRTASTTLLPFLYQTRTLQAKSLSRKARKPSSYASQSCRNFCSTPRLRAPDDRPRRNDSIPFEEFSSDLASSAPKPLPFVKPGRQSTITASEQAIFDRIFEDLSQSSARDDQAEEVIDEDLEEEAENNIGLQGIFDKAISNLRLQEDRSFETAERNRLQFSRLTPVIEGISDKDSKWGKPGEIGNDYEDLSVAHREHEIKVYGMLDRAKTDIELWRVLESEVFSLVQAFTARQKDAEKLSTAQTSKNKRVGRPSQKPEPEHNVTLLPSSSKALAPTILLSILQSNYGPYCLHAMRLLRRHFPTSPFSLCLLPQLKKLGPISYVLGASTSLYNEILFLQWTQYNDLHGIADLLDEMRTQGLEVNEVTLTVLKAVGRQRQRAREGQRGEVLRGWWGMEGVVEGWKRVNGGLRRVREEVADRGVSRAMEARGEVGGEGGMGEEEQERRGEETGRIDEHASEDVPFVVEAEGHDGGKGPRLRKLAPLAVRRVVN